MILLQKNRIEVVDGSHDILSSKCMSMVCPVNTKGIMGAGLAKKFKDQVPEFYDNYRYLCINNKQKPGTYSIFPWIGENVNYVAFYTKDHWKDESRAEWITSGLEAIISDLKNSVILRSYFDSIAFPMLGCGCGGLDENLVMQLLLNFARITLNNNLISRIEIYESPKKAK